MSRRYSQAKREPEKSKGFLRRRKEDGFAGRAAGTSELGLERETGFEPATLALARRCSTTELFPLATSSKESGFYWRLARLSTGLTS